MKQLVLRAFIAAFAGTSAVSYVVLRLSGSRDLALFVSVCAVIVAAAVLAVWLLSRPDREQQVLDEIDRPTRSRERESVVAAAFGKPRIK